MGSHAPTREEFQESLRALKETQKRVAIIREYFVGEQCPWCHKEKLKRGVKKNDKVQVYCSNCGFSADRCGEAKRLEKA